MQTRTFLSKNIYFKIICMIVAEIFIFTQLSWSQEAYIIPESTNTNQEDYLTNKDIANMQSQEQAIIDRMNMLQELQDQSWENVEDQTPDVRVGADYDDYSGSYSAFEQGDGPDGENTYIKEILHADGVTGYQFIRDRDGQFTTNTGSYSVSSAAVNYNAEGNIDFVVDEFGNKIQFDDAGLINSILQKSDITGEWEKIRTYTYEKDETGVITAVSAQEGDTIRRYNSADDEVTYMVTKENEAEDMLISLNAAALLEANKLDTLTTEEQAKLTEYENIKKFLNELDNAITLLDSDITTADADALVKEKEFIAKELEQINKELKKAGYVSERDRLLYRQGILTNYINLLDALLGNLDQDLVSIESSIAAGETNLDNAETAYNNSVEAVDTKETELVNLVNDIANLYSVLLDLGDTAQVSDYENVYAQIQSLIVLLDAKRTELENLNNNIEALEGDIVSLKYSKDLKLDEIDLLFNEILSLLAAVPEGQNTARPTTPAGVGQYIAELRANNASSKSIETQTIQNQTTAKITQLETNIASAKQSEEDIFSQNLLDIASYVSDTEGDILERRDKTIEDLEIKRPEQIKAIADEAAVQIAFGQSQGLLPDNAFFAHLENYKQIQITAINNNIEILKQEARDRASEEITALGLWEALEKTGALDLKTKKINDLTEEETLLKANLEAEKASRLTQLDNKYNLKEEKLVYIESLINQITAIDEEISSINILISNKTSQIADLELRRDGIYYVPARGGAATGELTDLISQITFKQDELELLKSDYLTSVTNKLTFYKTRLRQTKEAELASLASELASLQSELNVIEASLTSKQSELNVIQSEIDALNATKAIARGQYDNALAYIQNALGADFDITDPANVEIIRDTNGNIIEAHLLEGGQRVLENVTSSLTDVSGFAGWIAGRDGLLENELWNKTDDSNVIKPSVAFGGKATGSIGIDGYYPVEGAFDDVLSMNWGTATTFGPPNNLGWIQYELPEPKAVDSYIVYSSADWMASSAPKDWEFLASNDGANWIKLDSRTNQTNWTSDNLYRRYKFKNETAYKYYRMDVSSHNGYWEGSWINELYLLENKYEILRVDAAHEGKATGSIGIGGYYPVEGGFDDVLSMNWGTATTFGPPNNLGWLQYELPSAKKIEEYIVYSSADWMASSAPKDWKFLASNDGVNWVELDSQANQINWTADNLYRKYKIKNDIAYKYYRMDVSTHNGYWEGCWINELDLLENIYEPWQNEFKTKFNNHSLVEKDVNGQTILYSQSRFDIARNGFESLYNQYITNITNQVNTQKASTTNEDEKKIYEREGNTLIMIMMLEYKEQLKHLEQVRAGVQAQLQYLKNTQIPGLEQALKQLFQNQKIIDGINLDLEPLLDAKTVKEIEIEPIQADFDAKKAQRDAKQNEVNIKQTEFNNALLEENTIKNNILSKEEAKHQALNQIITLKKEESQLLRDKNSKNNLLNSLINKKTVNRGRKTEYTNRKLGYAIDIQTEITLKENQINIAGAELSSLQTQAETLLAEANQKRAEEYFTNQNRKTKVNLRKTEQVLKADKLKERILISASKQGGLIEKNMYTDFSVKTEEVWNTAKEARINAETQRDNDIYLYVSDLYMQYFSRQMTDYEKTEWISIGRYALSKEDILSLFKNKTSITEENGLTKWYDANSRIILEFASDGLKTYFYHETSITLITAELGVTTDLITDRVTTTVFKYSYTDNEFNIEDLDMYLSRRTYKRDSRDDMLNLYNSLSGRSIKYSDEYLTILGGQGYETLYTSRNIAGNIMGAYKTDTTNRLMDITLYDGQGSITGLIEKDRVTSFTTPAVSDDSAGTVVIVESQGCIAAYEKSTNKLLSFKDKQGNITYFKEQVYLIIKSDGTRIEDIVPDTQGRIITSKIILPDTTIMYVERGLAVKVIKPDTTEFSYTNGYVTEIKYPDGKVEKYGYKLTLQETNEQTGEPLDTPIVKVNGIYLTEFNSSGEFVNMREYDMDFNLLMYMKSDGIAYYYTGDIITKIRFPNGVLIKDVVLDADGNVSSGMQYYPTGEIAKIENSQIVWLEDSARNKKVYYKNGRIIKMIQGDIEYTYTYLISDLLIISDSLGNIREYQDGILIKITNNLGDIIIYENGQLKTVTYHDGTIINNITLDEYGNLKNYTAKSPDNVLRIFTNYKLSKVIMPSGREYVYSYEGDIAVVETEGTKSYYDQSGKLLYQENTQGIISEYEGDKLTAIKKSDGAVVIRYEYNKDGSLKQVIYEDARNQLAEYLSSRNILVSENHKQILDALAQRRAELESAISKDALDKIQAIVDWINSERDRMERESAVRLAEIQAEREKYQAMQEYLDRLNEIEGSQTEKQKQKEMQQNITEGLAKLEELESQILQDKQTALDLLTQRQEELLAQVVGNKDAQLDELTKQIEEQEELLAFQYADALKQLEEAQVNAQSELAEQEWRDLIDTYARKTLGRELSEDEYSKLKLKENFEAQRDFLAELAGQDARGLTIANIMQKLFNILYEYAELTSDEKEKKILEIYGLLGDDTIKLTKRKVDKIKEYLEAQDNHFAYSAGMPLEELLKLSGIEFNREELLTELILVDILTGGLDNLIIENGEQSSLAVSMFAIERVAKKYGLNLAGISLLMGTASSKAGGLSSVEEIHDLPNGVYNAIAHLKTNHYALLKEVTETEVTYFEPNRGANGEYVTVTKEEFLTMISGKFLTVSRESAEGAQLSSPGQRPGEEDSTSPILNAAQWRELTKEEMQLLKGAGFFKKVSKFFGRVGRAISGTLKAVFNAVKTLVLAPINIIKATIKGKGWGDILYDIGSIPLNLVSPAAELTFGSKAVKVIDKIGAEMKRATDKLELVAQGVYNYLKNTVEAIKNGDWKAIGSAILQIAMAIATSGVSLIFTAISIIVQNAMVVMGADPKIAAIAGMVISAIGSQFYPDASQTAGNIIGNGINEVGSAVQSAMEGVGDALGKVWPPMGNLVTNVGTGIKTAMGWVADWMGADQPNPNPLPNNVEINGLTGAVSGNVDAVLDGVVVKSFAEATMKEAISGNIVTNILKGTGNALVTVGVSEGLEELGLETQTAYTLGSAVSTDVNNRISGNFSALTNPFVNTLGAGVKYGLSEIGDSLGLNHFEMTGISIASEGLFKGATNMSSSGFGQGFSDTINNRISSVLSNTAQTAINSSLNGQPLNLDLGSMALSAYSNSLGATISHNMKITFNNLWNSVKNNEPLHLNTPLDGEDFNLNIQDIMTGQNHEFGNGYFGDLSIADDLDLGLDTLNLNLEAWQAGEHMNSALINNTIGNVNAEPLNFKNGILAGLDATALFLKTTSVANRRAIIQGGNLTFDSVAASQYNKFLFPGAKFNAGAIPATKFAIPLLQTASTGLTLYATADSYLTLRNTMNNNGHWTDVAHDWAMLVANAAPLAGKIHPALKFVPLIAYAEDVVLEYLLDE